MTADLLKMMAEQNRQIFELAAQRQKSESGIAKKPHLEKGHYYVADTPLPLRTGDGGIDTMLRLETLKAGGSLTLHPGSVFRNIDIAEISGKQAYLVEFFSPNTNSDIASIVGFHMGWQNRLVWASDIEKANTRLATPEEVKRFFEGDEETKKARQRMQEHVP
jgi:hypothetical protein